MERMERMEHIEVDGATGQWTMRAGVVLREDRLRLDLPDTPTKAADAVLRHLNVVQELRRGRGCHFPLRFGTWTRASTVYVEPDGRWLLDGLLNSSGTMTLPQLAAFTAGLQEHLVTLARHYMREVVACLNAAIQAAGGETSPEEGLAEAVGTLQVTTAS